jgi:hypothetical protein
MNIQSAISKHGAAAVYAAAHQHAAGHQTLPAVGLQPRTLADVWEIMSAAYAALDPAGRAIENAQSSAALELKI